MVQGDRTRLIISHMVLENFKSYAGSQIIGPFHQSFSSIVGPNGSGKSNVIDALLFVFGYRAKKMRQSKVSDLIHTSALFQNVESCAVHIHFEEIFDSNADEKRIMPDTEIVISRYAYKNNKSQYFINQKTSNFTEVISLLKMKGIDLDHKRFLILQGEVESIALMKPKASNENEEGLLEYLEDIIGTANYKSTIDDISKEFDSISDQFSEKSARFNYLEREKNALMAKKKIAEDFIQLENSHAIKKWTLHLIEIFNYKRSIAKSQEKIAKLNDLFKKESAKNENDVLELEKLEKTMFELSKEVQACVDANKKLNEKLSKLKKEDAQHQEKLKIVKSKQKSILRDFNTAKSDLSQQSAVFNSFEANFTKNEADKVSLHESLSEAELLLSQIQASLKGKTEIFQAQIEVKQKELAPWAGKILNLQGQIDISKTQLESLKKKASAGVEDLEALSNEQVQIEKLQLNMEGQLTEWKKQKNLYEKELSKVQATLQEHKSNKLKLQNEIKISESVIRDSQNAKSEVSSNTIASALLKEQKCSRLKGLYGRLGDLGAIDSKYDIAIGTACPGLDNIVVDSTATGQACIEILRQNKLGRATFIILDKIKKTQAKPSGIPSNIPRLFDLVVPKEKIFEDAFYHALRDTLVAENLEQARKIAYGNVRHRVVTLEGNLIEKSGILSGGGNSISRGGMKSFFSDVLSDKQIQEHLQRVTDLNGLIEELGQEIIRLEEIIKSAKNEIKTFDTNIQKGEAELKSTQAKVLEISNTIAEIRSKCTGLSKSEEKKVKELENSLNQLCQELEDTKIPASKIEMEIAEIQNKLMDAGGIRFRSQKAKVDSLKEQIELLITQNTKISSDMQLIQTKINLNKQSMESNEIELNALEKEISEASNSVDLATKEILSLSNTFQDAQSVHQSKMAEFEDIKNEAEHKKRSLIKVKAVENDLKYQIETETNFMEDNRQSLSALLSNNNHSFGRFLKPTEDDPNPVLPEYSENELEDLLREKSHLFKEISIIEKKISNSTPNLSVLEEYKIKNNEFIAASSDLEVTVSKKNEIKATLETLKKKRLDEFMIGFNAISTKLKEMYQLITLGGNAELELVDSLDPFSEGILFSVMPPKKTWKNISNLSGGEKTLSSLALVFALHHFKPTPIYVMDEIDAALDFRNVSIVANYLKQQTQSAQFIVISLRNNMFELANRLVGIYKTNDCTKTISIDPNDFTISIPS